MSRVGSESKSQLGLKKRILVNLIYFFPYKFAGGESIGMCGVKLESVGGAVFADSTLTDICPFAQPSTLGFK